MSKEYSQHCAKAEVGGEFGQDSRGGYIILLVEWDFIKVFISNV